VTTDVIPNFLPKAVVTLKIFDGITPGLAGQCSKSCADRSESGRLVQQSHGFGELAAGSD
jgi:hypothetical protein